MKECLLDIYKLTIGRYWDEQKIRSKNVLDKLKMKEMPIQIIDKKC